MPARPHVCTLFLVSYPLLYVAHRQKTWRNSDEVVTKLGLFPRSWIAAVGGALRSVRRQLGVALEPVCWRRALKRDRSPGECSSLEGRPPLSIRVRVRRDHGEYVSKTPSSLLVDLPIGPRNGLSEGTTRARSWTSPFLVSLAQQERAALERWRCATPIQAGLAKRAKLLLLRAESHLLSAVASALSAGGALCGPRHRQTSRGALVVGTYAHGCIGEQQPHGVSLS
jgi:hypothetical protein